MKRPRALAYRLAIPILRAVNATLRRAVAATHLFQFKVEGVLRPDAEWFDHQLDVYWQWPRKHRSSFLERGVLNALCIREGARVLELCSGDGFYAQRFYASLAREIVAIDGNAEAIAYAQRYNPADNLTYIHGDVRAALPVGPFDNVIWDGAIAHFSPEETDEILRSIVGVLTPSGILSGQTIYEPDSNYEFARQRFPRAEDLAVRLRSAFAHVRIREQHEPGRTNYYFFCSDDPAVLPFLESDSDELRSSQA